MHQLRPVLAVALVVTAASVIGVALSSRPDHGQWIALGVGGVPCVTAYGWPHRRRWLVPVVAAEIAIALVVLMLFRDYRDDPWFSDRPLDCDGPCTGWYSFENPLMASTWAIAGVTGAAVGMSLRMLRRRAGLQIDSVPGRRGPDR